MIERKIKKFIEDHALITNKDRVLVAYSGGADSTCLLVILQKLYSAVHAVYVNHQLRGKESAKEEKFVRSFCEGRNIPLKVERINWKLIPSDLEEAARKRRYRHLAKVAAEHGFTKIALAHQKDDVVETFLLRLIRGTGPGGLARMPAKRDLYIRPMLECSRQEIRDYLRQKNIRFFEDISNEKLQFARNRIRKKLIPYIQKNFNPSFPSAVERSSKWMEEQNVLLTELLEIYKPLLKHIGNAWLLDRESFLDLSPALQKSVLRMQLRRIDPSLRLGSRPLQRLLFAIHEHSSMELPGYLLMSCEQQACKFSPKKRRTGIVEVDVPAKGAYPFPAGDITLKFSTSRQRRSAHPGIAQLDADKASFPLYIRNWKKGDSFRPLGMKGTKKLSDYFIDRKIPRADRKTIPLVFKDDDLIWVSGYQIHENYKITPDTKNILLIETTRNH